MKQYGKRHQENRNHDQVLCLDRCIYIHLVATI